MNRTACTRFLAVLLLAALAGCAPPVPEPADPVRTPDPFIRSRLLTRGVNLGNALEAPREGEWGWRIEAGDLRRIAEAGFDSVRIPIRWSAHAETGAPYRIDAAFVARVDEVIGWALTNGLAAVVNVHHYEELIADPAGQRERFLAIWDQVARHNARRPGNVFFEVLNEPNGNLSAGTWNTLLAEALAVIRASNPYRTLIVDAPDWGSADALAKLELPDGDRNLIVTFHYYNPFPFTHQGAEWIADSAGWAGRTWSGTPEERAALRADFDAAAAWSAAHLRPLYLGEFGAYSKGGMDSRARWTAAVAREAEARAIPWAYWEFCSGFGAYDRAAAQWVAPLRDALLPPGS